MLTVGGGKKNCGRLSALAAAERGLFASGEAGMLRSATGEPLLP